MVGALGLGYLQELTTKSVEVYGDMQARVLDGRKRVAVDSNPRGQPALADFSAIKLYADVSPSQTLLRTGRNEWGESVRAAFVRVSDPRVDWTVVVMRPSWKIEEQARHAQTSTLDSGFRCARPWHVVRLRAVFLAGAAVQQIRALHLFSRGQR